MSRKQQTLTIDQINEFLTLTDCEQNETILAVREFLKAELTRRTSAGNTGGRPNQYEGSPQERNRLASVKYRAKQKESRDK